MMVDSRIEFIGKTAKSSDAARVAKVLDSFHIHVRGTVASATLLLSLVNLLARIFPNITVEALVNVSPFHFLAREKFQN
jgi:hypothetical protein